LKTCAWRAGRISHIAVLLALVVTGMAVCLILLR
jgi:hypothetical protein